MLKIAIVDKIGLCYDGNTLNKRGLGGSESAVILMARSLRERGFLVNVINNCVDTDSRPGMYDGVMYIPIDNKEFLDLESYDIVIVSRTALPFVDPYYSFISRAKTKILWLHDTFIEGDHLVEDLLINGQIDYIFTLSDFHTNYILNCDHGKRRNFEVLKSKVFQTRNGAVQHIKHVDLNAKDPNHFVYNASATKGMIPLLEHIWPAVIQQIPQAKLTVIGGYYRFRDGAEPDAQEQTVMKLMEDDRLKSLNVTFTGVITQQKIAEVLANASFTIYPGAFPETFGISTLESLLYNTPIITTRFGALEETAIDLASYKINYAIEPNSLFQTIDKQDQINRFVETTISAYHNRYLLQQKQNYCDVIKDIVGWDTIALQWKQFIYDKLGLFLPIEEYRQVERINTKVARIFGRSFNFPNKKQYFSTGPERRILVISPVWNACDYISKCIESTASQDYSNFLHIIIENMSNDHTAMIADTCIQSLSPEIQSNYIVIRNLVKQGAIQNQWETLQKYARDDDIVVLLDGDDWLVNNPTIFKYYNDLYQQGYEFTYGSMWSVADDIPLIAQDYPDEVKQSNSYRKHLFNWKIPYTHLRTFLGKHYKSLDYSKFLDENGNWMNAGADNPFFYELIERIKPEKIFCNKEIVCNYNDLNPLNDYKINSDQQNNNANMSYVEKKQPMKRVLIAIPTNKYIEPETMKSIYDLEIPEGYTTNFQYFYGYQIDQIRNLIAEWAKQYDYLLSVDSDIILPPDTLRKMIAADKDVISGLYIQRKPDRHILEVYRDDFGPTINIDYNDIKESGVVEIAACGFGACLVKSEVIRAMEYPHFVYKSALDHANTVSEDVFFCQKARQKGFKIWADATILCEHVGQTIYRVQTPLEQYVESVYQQDLLPQEHVQWMNNVKADGTDPLVIYDIGSCVRHWTRHAENVWPGAQVVLFEANPNVEKYYSDYDYYIGVLGDVDGTFVDFYLNPYNLGGNSYYKENTEHFNSSHIQRQIMMSLDTVVAANGWALPDMIKIDVQGAELDILKGAKNCLSTCQDIVVECQNVEYNIGAPKFEQVKEYLESLGFTLQSTIHQTDVDADYHFKKL